MVALLPGSPVRRALLCASSVATMLMFPLMNALAGLPIWLHWQVQDSVESAAAWASGVAVIATTLWLPAALGRTRLRDTIAAAWLILGVLFVIAAVVRLGAVSRYVTTYRSHALGVIALAACVLAGFIALAVARPGTGPRSRVERLLSLLWPLSGLLLFHLVRAPGLAASQESAFPAQASAPRAAASAMTGQRPLRTIVLLFDEMSHDYLFGDRAIDLSHLPALQRLREDGEVHRDVHLRGGATAIAIPALFAPRADLPTGLVGALQAQDRSTRVWGWYYDYCRMFARAADVCHSTSAYNVSTLHDGFSVLHPWHTNLNMLPAERPYDLLKVPAAVAFHRDTLRTARHWLQGQLADPRSDFIYVHVNVPHLPLLTGALRPFTLDADGYVAQFTYVDDIVGVAMADHTRPAQIIVMSDHNARPLFPQAMHDHIVFARYRPGVHGMPVETREDGAELLTRLSLAPPSVP